MIKSILLPVDGSEYTSAVLKYGIALVRTFEARLRVLSVVDIRIFEWTLSGGSDGFVPVVPAASYQEESRALFEKKAQAVLDKCTRILEKENLPFEAERISGSPVEVIAERSNLVDLLIMGNRGEYARWANKMVGATLEAVTRHVNKPILITPKKYLEIKNILVAYDGSDNSSRALQMTGHFGSLLKVPVTVVTVTDDEQMGSRICEDATAYLRPYGFKVSTKILSGNVEDAIISSAKDSGMDLIIIGAYGHSRIREAILGSTTSSIMRKATTAVLLAK